MSRITWFTPNILLRWAFGPKRPGVIVLHILGADFPLSRYMAARLADRGVAALFVKLPYYGERRPAGEAQRAKRFLSADIERSVTRCARRYATSGGPRLAGGSPGCRPRRTRCLGNQPGRHRVLAGGRGRPGDPGRGVSAGRGRPATILWEMPEGAAYRKQWIESGRTKQDLKTLTDPFDPLTYADGLKGKRLMMIAGKVDEVVPPASTLLLWEAAGRPPIHWCDCGHYSAVGYLLPGIRQTVDFFAAP